MYIVRSTDRELMSAGDGTVKKQARQGKPWRAVGVFEAFLAELPKALAPRVNLGLTAWDVCHALAGMGGSRTGEQGPNRQRPSFNRGCQTTDGVPSRRMCSRFLIF